MSLQPGTRLGSYEVTALIGQGGMGEVYRARDTKLGRDVALKVLPDVFADDPAALDRVVARCLATNPQGSLANVVNVRRFSRYAPKSKVTRTFYPET